jgi:hypothetical protein
MSFGKLLDKVASVGGLFHCPSRLQMIASAATLTRWRGRWHLSDVLDAKPSHDLPDNMVAQV